MQIYGYYLPTSPNLSKYSKKNLIVFDDVISSQAHTYESLSQALTFSNQENLKLWYEYINLIDAMNLGGYYTIALSNQESISLLGNAATAILKRAKQVQFTSMNDDFGYSRPDGLLLPLLKEQILKHQNTANFFVLHLTGNHGIYYMRYPKEFNKFSKSDIKSNIGDKQAIAEYANATLYGDFILSSIINMFKDSDSIVIYFSDHGEEVYDKSDFAGHSNSRISRFMVEIPFIIYVSDKFISKHNALYNRIKNAQHRRYMNDDLIHSVLDIAGVKIKGFEEKRSLFSKDSSFLDKRKRLVGDKFIDYDKYLRNK